MKIVMNFANSSFLKPLFVIGSILVLCGTAESGVLDMFSFFGSKKNEKTVTVINSKVGEELRREQRFPEDSRREIPYGNCQQVEYSGSPPMLSFLYKKPEFASSSAYLVTDLPNKKNFVFINFDNKIEVWSLNLESKKTEKLIDVGEVLQDQISFKRYAIVKAICLPNNRVLFAINTNRSHIWPLVVFDADSEKFIPLGFTQGYGLRDQEYFVFNAISDNTAIAFYFSENVMQQLEFDLNYYNHIVLFSSEFKNGLEILKLGLDVGNIVKLTVDNSVLYMETLDARGFNEITEYWSLNLNNLLKN